jgi:hypothetical protein
MTPPQYPRKRAWAPRSKLDPVERFWVNVERVPSGCLIWTGEINNDGYGNIWDGVRGKRIGAHVFSYLAFVGPIPDGLEIDHTCRVRSCVEPSHLEAVTHHVNVLRGNAPAAFNARKTHCKRGHELSGTNLYVFPDGRRRRCRACRRAARN